MKRQSLHVKDDAIYDQFSKQQVIWTHGYGATDGYVTRNEWGALLLQWPVQPQDCNFLYYSVDSTGMIPQQHHDRCWRTVFPSGSALTVP